MILDESPNTLRSKSRMMVSNRTDKQARKGET